MLRKMLIGSAISAAAVVGLKGLPAVGGYVGGWTHWAWEQVQGATPLEVQVGRAEHLIDTLGTQKQDFIVRCGELARGGQAIERRLGSRSTEITDLSKLVEGGTRTLVTPQAEYVLKTVSGQVDVLSYSALKARVQLWQADLAKLKTAQAADQKDLVVNQTLVAAIRTKLEGFDMQLASARKELAGLKDKKLDAEVTRAGKDLSDAIDGVSGNGRELTDAFERIRSNIDRIDPGTIEGTRASAAPHDAILFDGPSVSLPSEPVSTR